MPPDIELLKIQLRELFEIIDEVCAPCRDIFINSIQKTIPHLPIRELLEEAEAEARKARNGHG